MEDDMIQQIRWIEEQTGQDLDVLLQSDPERFVALAADWRAAQDD